MKTLEFAGKALTAAAFAAAMAFTAVAKDQYDIRPEATADKSPTAAEWQDDQANAKALVEATAAAELAKAVVTEAAAVTLLKSVKGAYLTDALAATKIAAVTQYVMTLEGAAWWQFWKNPVPAERVNWVKALVKTAKESSDPYVAVFCFDQLRWCGCAKCAACIEKAASEKQEKWVKDFAALVVKELKSR